MKPPPGYRPAVVGDVLDNKNYTWVAKAFDNVVSNDSLEAIFPEEAFFELHVGLVLRESNINRPSSYYLARRIDGPRRIPMNPSFSDALPLP